MMGVWCKGGFRGGRVGVGNPPSLLANEMCSGSARHTW